MTKKQFNAAVEAATEEFHNECARAYNESRALFQKRYDAADEKMCAITRQLVKDRDAQIDARRTKRVTKDAGASH